MRGTPLTSAHHAEHSSTCSTWPHVAVQWAGKIHSPHSIKAYTLFTARMLGPTYSAIELRSAPSESRVLS